MVMTKRAKYLLRELFVRATKDAIIYQKCLLAIGDFIVEFRIQVDQLMT